MSACVWSEDEVLRRDPDRQRIEDAWVELFGEPKPPRSEALREEDWGDSVAWVYEHGRIEVMSFDGMHIYCDNVQFNWWEKRRVWRSKTRVTRSS